KKIRQVVIEVHDERGRLREVEEELIRKGYEVKAEQEEELEGTNLYVVYAVRKEAEEEGAEEAEEGEAEGVEEERWRSREELIRGVKEYVRGRVPEYMVPSGYRVIE